MRDYPKLSIIEFDTGIWQAPHRIIFFILKELPLFTRLYYYDHFSFQPVL